ncbi:hypothetical protein BECAL_02311 [Bellilinea caldifistulae]|uniref:Uncharacterized protein n=1 Tax=Bellilinea caldifistulae TaxID=360411 RepID=A0A0P6XF92_9CHLR|nr:hypothetical protein [Bellilinea caldifistulae]KPL73844.1 hypothetical protein AC812_13730 [Bellilinea caldifistulae]GAP11126.1 hypothetical protein BECAL_02311 [Bellilinea caldifistulae]
MKRKDNGLIDLTAIDPVVEATLSQGRRRIAERSLPKDERKKTIREREKAAKRNRVMLDIDPAIMRDLSKLAEHYEISQSQLTSLALVLFLNAIEKGELDILPYLKPINNPRYSYVVNWNK